MAAGTVSSALATLTVRGRCLAVGGVTLLLVGMVLGERALVQMAVFVMALPLISAGLIARQRFRVSSRRVVTPARVPRGEDAEVLLEVTNADRHTGGLWVLSEQLPPELGPSPRFVIDRLGSGQTAPLQYRVHGARRGRHTLGPMRLRLVDPFGLVVRSTAGTDTVPLVVVPRVRPLGSGGPAGGQGGGGEGARRSIAVHGEDDVSVRAYRHGDDLRKVHWRATARTGELMVRLEERPWRSQATLFLDTRTRAHLLASRPMPDLVGPPGEPLPAPDSLEWLIEAAASIGTSLADRGAVLRAVTDVAELLPTAGRGGLVAGELLDRLASVRASRHSGLAAGIDLLCRVAGEGPVLCLLGAVGPDDVVELLRARSGPTTDFAVLIDVGSWADAGLVRGKRALSSAARGELSRQRDEATSLLRAGGWHVAVARADQTVAEVWSQLGPSPEAASRPAAAGGVGVPA